MSPLDPVAPAVLARYPALLRPTGLVALGNRGGFSGARLWRAASAAGPLCLRAWPEHETAARLAFRHGLMATARAEGLAFVPGVLPAADGQTFVACAGRLWELAEWLPGRADFHQRPTSARLAAACRALARLHAAWERSPAPVVGPIPAVRRRLDAAGEALRGGAPVPAAGRLQPLLARSRRLLAVYLPGVPPRLERWAATAGRLQPCLCDVWHEHLLFQGDALTGLVDYGAVKVDAVAVDLARLLGSLVADDDAAWQAGLRAYREVRPLSGEEEELARALDVTGTVLGVVNWLRWLAEGRPFDDAEAVARRLGELLERMGRWAGPL
jgi:homoserine kinase type II